MKTTIAMMFCAFLMSNASAQTSTERQTKPQETAMKCPMHEGHSTSMDERGEEGMGFSQTATTHRFFLKPDGGVIQVEVKDDTDRADVQKVRMHLTHIAKAFANGDFDIPMFVHDTVPPGVPDMKRLQAKIRYTFEETAAGGRVVITTGDPESLIAVQKFLRFQIEEHKMGDPGSIQ